MYDKEYVAQCRQVRFERVAVDSLVCGGPALIYSLTIHSDGVAEADAIVYDGPGAGAKLLLNLYCVDEAMAQLVFPQPVYVDQGIYIDIGTNCQAVTIQYMPVLGM